ncbi:MAG: hypothetical protein AB1673_16895, partial [Actinomycetota bacterium]
MTDALVPLTIEDGPLRAPVTAPAAAGRGRRALWTFATQGLSSGSNFLLTLFVLAAAGAREFAVFAVCLTAYLLTLGLARYVIGIPVLLLHAPPGGDQGGAGDRSGVGDRAAVGDRGGVGDQDRAGTGDQDRAGTGDLGGGGTGDQGGAGRA